MYIVCRYIWVYLSRGNVFWLLASYSCVRREAQGKQETRRQCCSLSVKLEPEYGLVNKTEGSGSNAARWNSVRVSNKCTTSDLNASSGYWENIFVLQIVLEMIGDYNSPSARE